MYISLIINVLQQITLHNRSKVLYTISYIISTWHVDIWHDIVYHTLYPASKP